MTEMFKTITPLNHPFYIDTKISVALDTKTELINFLRKMNIQHSFKQMPSKAIKLNIPIILIQTKSKPIKVTTEPKSTKQTKNSLLSNHDDDDEFEEAKNKFEPRKKTPKERDHDQYQANDQDVNKLKGTEYYFNNKPEFIKQMKETLSKIIQIKDDSSCDKGASKDFNPLTHQLIVKKYLDSSTPYRGLLLYHGLGSGKTCSSISIIEGMKHDQPIYVMTPASLQANYRTQMRYCGNQVFRNNNHWVFEEIKDEVSFKMFYKKSDIDEKYFMRNKALKKLILENEGIWVTDPEEENNYTSLNERQKNQLDEQIDLMIKTKYKFINFNGIRKSRWEVYTQKGTINPFDNSVVIIDEAHNFVSRIVNKINIKKTSISTELYEAVMDAENCRVILLTGTPFINYPSELGTLFNLISGYTYVLTIKLSYKPGAKAMNENDFKQLFAKNEFIDSIEYNAPLLKIVKTPYGFLKLPDGKMIYNTKGNVYLEDFKKVIVGIIGTNPNVRMVDVKFEKFKKLPDNKDEFNSLFVKGNTIDRKEFFQSKIVGMVSYLGDKKNLMPSIIKSTERDDEGKIIESDIHVEYIQMSKHQMDAYSKIRDIERLQEKSQKKREDESTSSTYKVFSRAVCNFAFPNEPPQDQRPMPGGKETGVITEDTIDAITDEEKLDDIDGKYDEIDLDKKSDKQYIKAINDVLARFEAKASNYFESDLPKLTREVFDNEPNLLKYSPKFYKILQNLMDPDNVGCHLLYTNFRKLEGIGLLRIILDYYGYCQLKIVNNNDNYEIKLISKYNIEELKEIKCFALYTGTETAEEKEIIRNIYNSNYDALPNSIRQQLRKLFPNKGDIQDNIHGDVIQLLMITASGAEGIDLKNTRFVHITEPYWHHVRVNQVIGRARRICSHTQLEKELQDVKVFMYISYFGDIDLEQYPNIKNLDERKSTDVKLYEIMKKKERLSTVFLDALKETAIDCTHKCFKTTTKKEFITEVDYTQDKIIGYKKTAINEIRYSKKTINSKPYVLVERINADGTREGHIEVYNFDDYNNLKMGLPIDMIGIYVDDKIVKS